MTQLELHFGKSTTNDAPTTLNIIAEGAPAASETVETDERISVVEDTLGESAELPDTPVKTRDSSSVGQADIPDRDGGGMRLFARGRPDLPLLQLTQRPDTLDEAILALRAADHLDPILLKRLASDVRMATKLVHRTIPNDNAQPPSLPCAPVELRDHLAHVLPARYRMTAKRWSSIKSSIVMVLKVTGWHATNTDLYAPLTPAWRAAAGQIVTQPQRALVAALGRYCARLGIDPANVTEETLDQFKAWRSENTLDPSLRQNVSALRCIWNRAQRRCPDWPGRRLEPPSDPRSYVLPQDKLDPRFLADLDAYLERLQTPSPLDKVFNRRRAPLTIADIRGSLLRAASVLMSKGIAITCIRDAVTPASYKAVLLEAYFRLGKGDKWPIRAASIASYLHAAARDWARLPPDELKEVIELRKMVRAPVGEMTQKSRDRIAQFDDPKLLVAFFGLPDELFVAADQMFKTGKPKRAAYLHQEALALAILQVKPLRRRNLAALEYGRHFLTRGARKYAELLIPGAETKTGTQLQAVLPDPLARRVEIHVSTYRPLIQAAPSPFLFPNPAGYHIADRTLAQNITNLIKRHIGAVFNVHVVRHLAATMLIEEDESNLPVAQTLLGHRDSKTTARFYAQQRTRGAQIKWMQMLETRVEKKRRGMAKRSRQSAKAINRPRHDGGT